MNTESLRLEFAFALKRLGATEDDLREIPEPVWLAAMDAALGRVRAEEFDLALACARHDADEGEVPSGYEAIAARGARLASDHGAGRADGFVHVYAYAAANFKKEKEDEP